MRAIASMAADLIVSDNLSPFGFSKDPDENTMLGNIRVGCGMVASDMAEAFPALMSSIACLTDLVDAERAPQFKDVYALRKYDGDAKCITVLNPIPTSYILSEAVPKPLENIPCVAYDCLGRAWVTIDTAYSACTALEDDGKTTYTFPQTYGDGTPAGGKPFSFTIPTIIGLPDFPEPTSDGDKIDYTICYNDCTKELEWRPKTGCATETEKGLVRFLTDEEAADENGLCLEGVVLTPKQTCAKIEEALSSALDNDDAVVITDFEKEDGVITSLTIDGEVCQLGGGSGSGSGGGAITEGDICPCGIALTNNTDDPSVGFLTNGPFSYNGTSFVFGTQVSSPHPQTAEGLLEAIKEINGSNPAIQNANIIKVYC